MGSDSIEVNINQQILIKTASHAKIIWEAIYLHDQPLILIKVYYA